MKILDKVHIRSRGDVFCVTVDVEVTHAGARVRRLRDGASWPVRGFERYCSRHLLPTLKIGEGVGMLVPDGCDLVVGDDVEIVPAATAMENVST